MATNQVTQEQTKIKKKEVKELKYLLLDIKNKSINKHLEEFPTSEYTTAK